MTRRRVVAAPALLLLAAAHDALTAGCNACQAATGFGFNVVVRPRTNTFANQDFHIAGK